jgi:hypothetical protein
MTPGEKRQIVQGGIIEIKCSKLVDGPLLYLVHANNGTGTVALVFTGMLSVDLLLHMHSMGHRAR